MNAIDNKSKFVLAHSFVDKRTKEECVKFLKQIKDSCYEQMLEIYRKEKNKPMKKEPDKEIERIVEEFVKRFREMTKSIKLIRSASSNTRLIQK